MASAPGPLVDGCLHLGLGGQASAMPGAAVALSAGRSRERLRGQPPGCPRQLAAASVPRGDGNAAA